MSATELPAVRVSLDVHASPEEVDHVERVFRDAGLEADVRAEWEKPEGVGNGAFWMVLVVLGIPAGAFLKSFGETLGKKAGEAAWEGIKRFAQLLRDAREPSVIAETGWFELSDLEGTVVMIGDEPDEAFQQLMELDWENKRGWMLLWDDDGREWFDPNRR